MRLACIVLCALLHAAVASAASCDGLKSLSLPQTTITGAESIAAGPVTLRTGTGASTQRFKDAPEFCRVTATLRPSADSDIKIEVWLPPASAWNGKYMGIGNGGWAGTISYDTSSVYPSLGSLMVALRKGYATASTDTGHTGTSGDGSFALGHPEKVIDFGYHAVHEMTVNAKLIIAAYYGSEIPGTRTGVAAPLAENRD